MNMMFYEIIEGKFQLLGLAVISLPLSFPEKETHKPLRGLGAAREGVGMGACGESRRNRCTAQLRRPLRS